MAAEFATADRILFGAGAIHEVAPAAASFGRRALVVTGSDSSRAAGLLAALSARGLSSQVFPVRGEPTTDRVRQAVAVGEELACDVVIGFGGGSALDAGKAVAALLGNGGDPLDYLEVVGRGRPLTQPSFPYIAIPTTAGTGAEVTRNAVLLSPEHSVKVSLRGPTLLPDLAVVDPELTTTMPPQVTAHTGLDALTQLIEPFTSHRANPLVDPLCLAGIGDIAWALRRAVAHGEDAAARTAMSRASLFGGLALANAGLGAAHGLAAPVGGAHGVPHGAACAALLPAVMAVNIGALRSRAPGHQSLARYEQIARLVTGRSDARADDGVAWVAALVADLGVPGLRAYGIDEGDLPDLVVKGLAASSIKANPLPLISEEMLEILQRAL